MPVSKMFTNGLRHSCSSRSKKRFYAELNWDDISIGHKHWKIKTFLSVILLGVVLVIGDILTLKIMIIRAFS